MRRILILCLSLAGCRLEPATIHPRFSEIRPAEIAVMPVENRSFHDLSQVSTAGPLQRLTIGARQVDLPAVLKDALLLGLRKKGYRAEPVESGGAGPRAALFAHISEFRLTTPSSRGDMEIAGLVRLMEAGDQGSEGGQVLYEKSFRHRTGFPGSGPRTPADLEGEVRRAGLAALRELPAASPEGAGPEAAGEAGSAPPPEGAPFAAGGGPPRP